ncbi:MAG: Vgb family protein [Pirellulaceae bacterium]
MSIFSKVFLAGLSLLLLLPATLQADLFVSAASTNSVMRFDCNTGAFLGNFVAPGTGGLMDPQGIAFGPDGNLYVSSNGSNNVLRFNGQTGAFIDIFATVTGMNWPAEISFRNNHLYVSDFSFPGGRVSRFNATTGAFVDHFAINIALADGQEWDTNGDLLVSAFGTSSIRRYDGTNGSYLGDLVTPGTGGLNGPLDNLFLPNGNLLVSSFNTGSVKEYDANGNFLGDAIAGLAGPQGLEIGPDGHLYAGDFTNGVINRYDINTFAFLGTFATAPNAMTNNFVFRPVPEPGSGCLLACLLGSLVVRRRRNNR